MTTAQYIREYVQFQYAFLAAFGTYITLYSMIDQMRDEQYSEKIPDNSTFDFIIVGAGSAGAVVASRLSIYYNVLLIEAGGDPMPGSYIPSFSFYFLNAPEVDWMHRTVPQFNACLSMPNQESGWSQGKLLGGTSNANFLIHSRGSPKDFEQWAELTGDPSWNYDGVLPFFKRSEDYHGKYSIDKDIHGKGGPMRIEIPSFTGGVERFLDAAEELGYPSVDLNGRFTEGFDYIYSPLKKGRRQGTYASYIAPIRKNPRLNIAKFATAYKILISEDNRAYGVQYVRHKKHKTAFATKEMIVSAGAVESPKLLLLSGIGPKADLESLKIPVKVDSPAVGQNLQDHISVYLGPFFVDPGSVFNNDRDSRQSDILTFFFRGKGFYTSSGIQGMGFITTEQNKMDGQENWPDIQLLYAGVSVYQTFAKDISRGFHLREDIAEEYYKHAIGNDSFFIITSLARPIQRGQIQLRDNQPTSAPLIDPKYLQNPKDVKTLVAGIKKAVELVETTESFKKINGRFTTKPFPGCENVEFRSDEYWECLIRHMTITLHHIVGSCSMGKRDSPKAVVDPELRVIGVENLRVIDASVMPYVPIGNTNAPSVMIGEKGAVLILSQWGKNDSNAYVPPPRPPPSIRSFIFNIPRPKNLVDIRYLWHFGALPQP